MRDASWIVRFGQHSAENNEWCSLQHGIVFLWSVIHSFLWWLHSGCYFTLVSVWKDWPMNEHQMWCQLLEWSDSIRNGVTWYTLLHFLCRSVLVFFVHWFQPACNAFFVCVCVCASVDAELCSILVKKRCKVPEGMLDDLQCPRVIECFI